MKKETKLKAIQNLFGGAYNGSDVIYYCTSLAGMKGMMWWEEKKRGWEKSKTRVKSDLRQVAREVVVALERVEDGCNGCKRKLVHFR